MPQRALLGDAPTSRIIRPKEDYDVRVRRLRGVAVVLLALASCADARQQSGGAPDRVAPERFRRIVRQQARQYDFTCTDPSSCSPATIANWPVPDPRGPGEFQLVITLTFSYRLSAGDLAHLGISTTCPLTDPPSPCPTPVPSRTMPLASHDGPMTTTVMWALHPRDGPGSFVHFMADLDDRSGDGSVRLATRRVTAVFEMWPS